jgi:hypothetical protein
MYTKLDLDIVDNIWNLNLKNMVLWF